MTDRLRIAFAQMNQRVGDLEGNARAMLEMRSEAAGAARKALVAEPASSVKGA